MSLFNSSSNLFSSNISQQTQPALFGVSPENKNPPQDDKKLSFTSSLFNNINKSPLFSIENNQKDDIFKTINKINNNNNENKSPFINPSLEPNKNKDSLFQTQTENINFNQFNIGSQIKLSQPLFSTGAMIKNVNDNNEVLNNKSEKEKEIEKVEKKEIFVDKKQTEDKKTGILWENPPNQEKNSLFKIEFGKDKNEINNNSKNDIDSKEEDKKENKKDEINKETKKVKSIFGTPKKEKEQEEKTGPSIFILNKDKNSNENNLDNNDINNLSFSKRIEDNEELQTALKNLYVSDILLPNKKNKQSPFINNEKIKNKIKRSRPIYFKLIIEIEGNRDIDNKGYNLQCESNETMSNLLKQIELLVKRVYKTKELNDFKFNLIKNSKKLPINEKALIGDNIKNKDIIIASLNYLDLEQNEKSENEENEEEEIKFEKTEKLCPKEYLPILKRPGYYMNPNEYEISRMTMDEIKNVENFEIYNENGKIHFDIPVSLLSANFDKIFNIEHDLIEYEKEEWCHSPRGKNFNIPATITLYNICPNIDISNENIKRQYIYFLKEKCQNNLNGELISYDFKTCELKYKIPYFY